MTKPIVFIQLLIIIKNFKSVRCRFRSQMYFYFIFSFFLHHYDFITNDVCISFNLLTKDYRILVQGVCKLTPLFKNDLFLLILTIK